MKLIVRNSQVLVATKTKEEEFPKIDIRVNRVKRLQVKRFKYLGTAVCWNAKHKSEIRQKVDVAKVPLL